ncbi:MAG: glycoside hydrolase family 3 C-terminal domain-containing protein [Lachnospiraceae bacterium]|nr:glycoside hydrolase family 3 C-terminal domain-containing protein [Lachnospiraceae bacterium]
MELLDYEKLHTEKVASSLGECMVLLKKDGKFPLDKPCKIAAYGSGVRKTIKGGTGSGEVNSHYSITIEEGLKNAGFEVVTGNWLDEYGIITEKAKKEFVEDIKKRAKEAHMNSLLYSMGKVMTEPEYNIEMREKGDACIYVLSRISGEGNDRPVKTGEIKLSATEKRDILTLNDRYERFMLVLNVGGVVDLTDVKDVKNILLLSQLGVDTGTGLADVLLGKQNPSGKLATTWATYEDYFPMDDFEDINETRYREGIYVGYRYFDSFDKKAIFPFGYGLSYTEFKTDFDDVKVDKSIVTVKATVENVGDKPGKEVVQLYQSAPIGKLDKSYQDLVGFAKTSLLQPGEKQQVEIEYDMKYFTSYDEESASYILEAGDYVLRLGNDSVNTSIVAALNLESTVTVMKAKNVLEAPDFEDLKSTVVNVEIPAEAVRLSLDVNAFATETVGYDKEYEILPEIEALGINKAALLTIGGFNPKKGAMSSIIGNAGSKVCGSAGETSSFVSSDFPVLTMADGPAGLRIARDYFEDKKGKHVVGNGSLPESVMDFVPESTKFIINTVSSSAKPKVGTEIKHQYCTAIPIGFAIAQSFNVELAKEYGDIVGQEMEMFGVNLWLAPALNIHRSIRCGRNFEYFSEDPFISGVMAAALTNGVQAHPGCGTTIKHYAANNKELNRYCNDSIMSERALREIYTRGFGICVRNSQPHAVMTAYNLVNGQHAAEHRGLIEDILRCEYGFEGIVMTDWIVSLAEMKESIHRNSRSRFVAMAGGDLFMPGGKKDYDDLKSALLANELSEEQVKINASRVLAMAKKLAGNQ